MKNVTPLPFFSLLRYLKNSLKILTTCLVIVLVSTPENILQACGGTPPPPCGRAVFLGKFTPGVVVFPAAGPINVPIGVLPFAQWNIQGLPNAPICPQPVGATLTLTLTCFPSGTVIGPQAFPVPIPTVPGAQPLGAPVNFVIPAGVFPAGSPPQICLVVGTYTVTFSDGVALAFNGDTEVCLVPPTPLNATKPQLEMRYLSENDDGYKNCRRGDQAIFYFLIANNDPDQSVSLDLNSIGRQVGQLPEGFDAQNAYENDVYSVSFPEADTDTYAAAFADELMPGELLEEPDPHAVNQQLLTRSFTLEACEAIIVGIAMRSYGMCANGSCNERLVKVEGTFENGDPALACASTLYVVDEVPAKTVLCEFLDSVKVSSEGLADWGPGTFTDMGGPIPHAQTFAAGNLPPNQNTFFRTTGAALPDLFSATGSSYLRIDRPTTGMTYEVNFNSPQCGGGANIVTVEGLDDPVGDFVLPVILFQGATGPSENIFDFLNNQLTILVQGDIVFQGPIDLFFADPPPEFCIDFDICRIIKKRADFSEKSITVIPPAASHLFVIPFSDPGCDTFEVFDNAMGPATWDAVINGNGITLPASSGTGMLEACYDGISLLPEVPETTISYIEVTCPGALNTVSVPIAIRVKDSTVNSTTVFPEDLAEKVVLYSFNPNPFSSVANIDYTLSESADLSLRIYNTFGKEVRSLINNQRRGAGQYTQEWDGQDNFGNPLSTGLYICQINVDGIIKTSNVVLVR